MGHRIRLSGTNLTSAETKVSAVADDVSSSATTLSEGLSPDAFGPLGQGLGDAFQLIAAGLSQHAKGAASLLGQVAESARASREAFEEYEETTSEFLNRFPVGEGS